MSTALYRRYRPDSYADVIGQEHVTGPLMQALRSNRVNHAYLFSGPRGCGKTTSARILARILNCHANTPEAPRDSPCGTCPSCVDLATGGPGSLDVVEIDAASHGGVDDARELRERATFSPSRDRFKIFILDEAHMVTPQGFNALLKIVEEPPEYLKFIFATTEPDKVIGTIRSRTHHYPFRLIPPDVMTPYVERLCAEEGVQVGSGVMPLVVRAGGGSARDTLSVMDQLIAGSDGGVVDYELAVALLGYTHATLLDDVVEGLAVRDGASIFRVIERVIGSGHEPRRFVEDLLERFRDLIVIAVSGEGATSVLRDLPADQMERMRQQAHGLGAAELSRAADLTNDALTEMSGATSPRLHLELLCARLLLPAADDGTVGLAARLDRLERGLVAAPGAPAAVAVAPAATQPAPAPAASAGPAPTGAASGRGAAAARQALAAATGRIAPAESSRASDAPGGAPVAAPGGRVGAPGATPVAATIEPVAAPAPASAAPEPSPESAPAPAPALAPAPAAAPSSDPTGAAPTDAQESAVSPGHDDLPPWDLDLPDDAPSHRDVPAASHRDVPAAPTTPAAAPQPAPAEPARSAPVVPTVGLPEAPPSAPAPTPAAEVVEAPAAAGPGEPVDATPAPEPVQASAPAAAAQPAAGASSGAAAQDSEMLRRRWPEVLETLSSLKRATWVLVKDNAQVAELTSTTLRLTFGSPGLATTFRNGPHAALVQQAVHETLGFDVRVEGGVDDARPAPRENAAAGRGEPDAEDPDRAPHDEHHEPAPDWHAEPPHDEHEPPREHGEPPRDEHEPTHEGLAAPTHDALPHDEHDANGVVPGGVAPGVAPTPTSDRARAAQERADAPVPAGRSTNALASAPVTVTATLAPAAGAARGSGAASPAGAAGAAAAAARESRDPRTSREAPAAPGAPIVDGWEVVPVGSMNAPAATASAPAQAAPSGVVRTDDGVPGPPVAAPTSAPSVQPAASGATSPLATLPPPSAVLRAPDAPPSAVRTPDASPSAPSVPSADTIDLPGAQHLTGAQAARAAVLAARQQAAHAPRDTAPTPAAPQDDIPYSDVPPYDEEPPYAEDSVDFSETTLMGVALVAQLLGAQVINEIVEGQG